MIQGWMPFVVVTALAAAIDLATKTCVFRSLGMPGMAPPVVLLPGILRLETNLNEGALFGMGQGMGGVFATVSVLAIIGILALVSRPATRHDGWLLVALGLIVGGIIGNLYDRLGLPGLRWHAPLGRRDEAVFAVRDWIHVTVPGVIDWPIFNLADSWLVIGAGMMLVASFMTPAAPPAQRSDAPSERVEP